MFGLGGQGAAILLISIAIALFIMLAGAVLRLRTMVRRIEAESADIDHLEKKLLEARAFDYSKALALADLMKSEEDPEKLVAKLLWDILKLKNTVPDGWGAAKHRWNVDEIYIRGKITSAEGTKKEMDSSIENSKKLLDALARTREETERKISRFLKGKELDK
jgi:hypothetical protein